MNPPFVVKEFVREGRTNTVKGYPIGLCRMIIGIMWLGSAFWKLPPDFGQTTNSGLWAWVQQAAQYPSLGLYGTLLEKVVIPHFTFFGYLLFVLELFTGLLLFLGLLTCLPSVLGVLMSLNLMVAMLAVPCECPWTYIFLVMFHLIFFITRAGRNWGLDQILLEKTANWPDVWSTWRRIVLALV
jgi:thiosulfate dehydrogenase [quinone] large subunit